VKVIVAGGSGFIGRALVEALLRAGDEPVVLSRRATEAERRLADGAQVAQWTGEEVEPALVAGADAVVNLSGASIGAGRWTRGRKARILASRVRSTAALVEALAQAEPRPRVLVNASGIDYGGDRGDDEIDENVAPGDTFLARVCVEWEAAARPAEELRVRVVCMRTPLVLGREALALRLMALPFRVGLGGRLGDGRQWFPFVHLEDAVALYRVALEDESLAGPLNLAAPEQVRQRDVALELGRVLHRPARFPTPAPLLRLVLGEQADLLLHGQRASAQRALATGYRFRYPTVAGALEEALGRDRR